MGDGVERKSIEAAVVARKIGHPCETGQSPVGLLIYQPTG